jgi:nucleoside phosphorylase
MAQYIRESVDVLRALPNLNDPSFPGRDQDRLFKSDYDHVGDTGCSECDQDQVVGRLPRASDIPVVHYGLIASGNAVIRSAKFRDRLRDAWNVLCFEMEAAGLMNRFPCIVIRGICDYSDGHKSKIWQPYAAIAAAAYARDLLRILGPEQVTRTEVATNILQDGI